MSDWYIDIAHEKTDGGSIRYRAELWWRPFTGWCVAYTAWRATKAWARRDGNRFLRLP